MQKIYGLFVAINTYANVRNLEGCLNDVDNLLQYLRNSVKNQKQAIKAKLLLNEKATKKNIEHTFVQHLGQASKNDICLFYFSGHGGREKLPSFFQNLVVDTKMEVLACYDSSVNKKGSFLADKELRFLIYQLYRKTSAQIITIFDCCHSGNNTKHKYNIKQLWKTIPSRNWNDFIFAKEIKENRLRKENLETLLPQGCHLQLAACQSGEKALENAKGGLFTTHLIQSLNQAKGKISYANLINILKLKLKNQYKQTPSMEYFGESNIVYNSFLGGYIEEQPHLANLVHLDEDYWGVDRGAFHGINSKNLQISINLPSGERAKIVNVFQDYTKVKFSNGVNIDKDKDHSVSISGIKEDLLSIHIFGEKLNVSALKEQFKNHLQKITKFKLCQHPNQAAYLVKVLKNKYIILASKDNLPVCQPILIEHRNSTIQLIQFLNIIAEWTFVKKLNNHESFIKDVAIHIFAEGENSREEVLIINNKVNLAFPTNPKNIHDNLQGTIRIKIRNNSSFSYYCALFYLSQNFGINPDLLDGVKQLAPQDDIWAMHGQAIPYVLEPYTVKNRAKETHYLKLIISSNPFDILPFIQQGLPSPDKLVSIKPYVTKGTVALDDFGAIPDWTSQLIEINLSNPFYK